MANLTTTDLDNGKIDLETLSTITNSQTETTAVTRLGDTTDTWYGKSVKIDQAIINSGYQVLGSFASGVTLTAVNQVLDYDGGLYRTTEVLPYTTDGAAPDLDSGEWVVVSDGVLSGIARSLNVLDSEVIYSTDTVTILDDVLYIYDASAQVTWGKPSSVGAGEIIVSVIGDSLTTTAGTYTLIGELFSRFPYQSGSIEDMILGVTVDGSTIVQSIGQAWSVGGDSYSISSTGEQGAGDEQLSNGLWANLLSVRAKTFSASDELVVPDPVNNAGPLFNAQKTVTKHAQYGFIDRCIIDYDGTNGGNQARAAYNDQQQNIGSVPIDHCHSYQTTVKHDHLGTTKAIHGFYSRPVINSGTVELLTGMTAIFTDIDSSADVNKQIGLNIALLPGNADVTYGIYSYHDLDSILSGTLYLNVNKTTGEKDPDAPNLDGVTGALKLNSKLGTMQFDSPSGYNFIGPKITLSPTFTGVRYANIDASSTNNLTITAPLTDTGAGTVSNMRLAASNILPHEEGSLGTGTLATPTALGTNSEPFRTLYHRDALVQVSDRNKKDDIVDMSDAEVAVALECKGMVKSYKIIGGDGKIEFGLIAQDVFDVFTKHGLDPDNYNVVVHDENGENFGLCYTALMCMIIGAI